MLVNGVQVDDTFAEAFPMKATRLVVTARTRPDLLVKAALMILDPV